MKIIISNTSDVPIYEQIKNQIKNMIITGELKEDDALPGMRSLAKDLRVSVITTKRAYNDLESEGYIYTLAGRGSFVKKLNSELIKEDKLREIEKELNSAIDIATSCGIDLEELIDMLKVLWR
jgi:GntR family transcriptional regulator